jgi:hypothetical protein
MTLSLKKKAIAQNFMVAYSENHAKIYAKAVAFATEYSFFVGAVYGRLLRPG